MKYFFGVTGE